MSKASYDEETSNKILRQVEFYFSDSNLPKDDFLRKLVEKSKDGLCSFSRMRNYLGLGNLKAADVPERIVNGVADILQKSDALKVSKDGKRIGRLRKLANPEKVLHQVDCRTVAASPLAYDTKIEAVQAFFGQYGKVYSVRLPKHALDKSCFCGTALIEFSSEKEASDVLELKMMYDGMEVELKPKKEFDTEIKRSAVESNKSSSCSEDKKVPRNDLSYEKGLVVSFALAQRVSGGLVRKSSSPVQASDGLVQSQSNGYENSTDVVKVNEGVAEDDGHADKKRKRQKKRKRDKGIKAEEEHLEIDLKSKKNSTDRVSVEKESKAAAESDAVSQQNNSSAMFKDKVLVAVQDLEDVFSRFGTVKRLHFDDKMDHGYVCFKESNAALKARAAADLLGDRGIIAKNCVAFLEAVTGEAEKEYWKLNEKEYWKLNEKEYWKLNETKS